MLLIVGQGHRPSASCSGLTGKKKHNHQGSLKSQQTSRAYRRASKIPKAGARK